MKKKIDTAVYKFSIDDKDYRAWSVNSGISQIEVCVNNQWELLSSSNGNYTKILQECEYRAKRALSLKGNETIPF